MFIYDQLSHAVVLHYTAIKNILETSHELMFKTLNSQERYPCISQTRILKPTKKWIILPHASVPKRSHIWYLKVWKELHFHLNFITILIISAKLLNDFYKILAFAQIFQQDLPDLWIFQHLGRAAELHLKVCTLPSKVLSTRLNHITEGV